MYLRRDKGPHLPVIFADLEEPNAMVANHLVRFAKTTAYNATIGPPALQLLQGKSSKVMF